MFAALSSISIRLNAPVLVTNLAIRGDSGEPPP